MTEPGDDFETFLKTRTVLPNYMSDDDKLEPPKALDVIVLNKAREAIRAQQEPNRKRRWATPVALAATILLCLSILLNVGLNTNRPGANLRRMTAATADKASPTSASPVGEGERRENVSGGAPTEAILPEAKVVEPRAPRPPVIAEAATPAPGESLRTDAPAVAKADALAKRSGRRALAPKEAASAPDAAADKATQLAARSSTQSPKPGITGLADESRVPMSAGATSESAAGLPPEASVEAKRAQPVPAKDKPAAAPPPHPQDPETWLQQIAALRAEGKTAQADAEMQRFRATFPAYQAKPGLTAPSEAPK